VGGGVGGEGEPSVVSSWKTGKVSGATTCSKVAGARAEERLVVLEEEEQEVLAGADAAIEAMRSRQ